LDWGEAYAEQLGIYTGAARSYIQTQDAIHTNNLEMADSVEDTTDSLFANTKESINNRGVIMDAADAVLAHTQTLLDQGYTIDEANAALTENREGLLDAAEAAGLNRGQVEQLLDQLGLMPTDIETVIRLSGEQIAQKKIEAMLLDMETLDEGVVSEVVAIAETDGAWAALHYLERYRAATTLDVFANTAPARRAINALRGAAILVNIAARSAEGRYVDRPMVSTLGEGGRPEVVLPLTNPGRMAALLGMPEVFGPVAAAMGKLVPAGAMSGLGGGGYSGGSSTYMNVTVNMPPGSNGQDVVNALRKYQRRAGPVPISVR
jgi:hypothetical protein